MHDRADHIKAKNPDMPKSEAFAIATQQMHSLGKTPKGYGTATGKRTAKKKYKTPEDDVKTAAWKDKLPGGLSDKKTPDDFDSSSLREGRKVEKEHTKDKHLQTEISMDHLTEDPAYYKKLKKIEKKAVMNLAMMQAFADEFIQIKEAAGLFPAGHAGANMFGSAGGGMKPVAPMSNTARAAATGTPRPAAKPAVDASRGMASFGEHVAPQPTPANASSYNFAGQKKPPPLPVAAQSGAPASLFGGQAFNVPGAAPLQKAASIRDRALRKIARGEGFGGFTGGGGSMTMSSAPRPGPAPLPMRPKASTNATAGGTSAAVVGMPDRKKPLPMGALNPGGGMH